MVLFAILILLHKTGFSQQEFINSLDKKITEYMQKWQIPGAAIAIIKDKKIVKMQAYGVKKINTQDKVDIHTLFMIGSNTKAFTGTIMALLESQGKCNLEDKVIKYLPNFTMKDSCRGKNLTLTDILCHRMGMQTFQGDFMYWNSDLTNAQVIDKFGKLTPSYDFRTKYGYTNAGFTIAAECIKNISGKTWQEMLQEFVFTPLKMNNTVALSVDIPKQKNIAYPHSFYNNQLVALSFPNIDNLAAAASIGSSVYDMTHWVSMLLDSGKFENKNVIPYKVIKRTWYPQTIVKRNNNSRRQTHYSLYGLGWHLEDYEGKEIVSHTGGVDGFVTSVTLVPEINLGIIILTNTDQNILYEALKWEIVDAYLNLPPYDLCNAYYNYDYSNKLAEQEELKAIRDSINHVYPLPLPLKAFAGKYVNPVYGWAELKVEENTLEMTLQHHSRITAKLEHIANGRFLCTYNTPTYGVKIFPFVIKDKKVLSFTLSVADFLEYTTYEFIKQ